MQPVEDTEENEDDEYVTETEYVCAYCDHELEPLDTIHLLEIAMVGKDAKGDTNFYAVEGEDGDYKFEPYFFHQDCWDEVVSDLSELIKDLPPLPETEPEVCHCHWCGSPIGNWNQLALIHTGELYRSERAPEGEQDLRFLDLNASMISVCINCISKVNEELLEMWEGSEE